MVTSYRFMRGSLSRHATRELLEKQPLEIMLFNATGNIPTPPYSMGLVLPNEAPIRLREAEILAASRNLVSTIRQRNFYNSHLSHNLFTADPSEFRIYDDTYTGCDKLLVKVPLPVKAGDEAMRDAFIKHYMQAIESGSRREKFRRLALVPRTYTRAKVFDYSSQDENMPFELSNTCNADPGTYSLLHVTDTKNKGFYFIMMMVTNGHNISSLPERVQRIVRTENEKVYFTRRRNARSDVANCPIVSQSRSSIHMKTNGDGGMIKKGKPLIYIPLPVGDSENAAHDIAYSVRRVLRFKRDTSIYWDESDDEPQSDTPTESKTNDSNRVLDELDTADNLSLGDLPIIEALNRMKPKVANSQIREERLASHRLNRLLNCLD